MKQLLEEYIRRNNEYDEALDRFAKARDALFEEVGDGVYLVGDKAVLIMDDRVSIINAVRPE